MRGANFRGANLSGADLRGNLEDADLSRADLSRAKIGILRNADLMGANLSEVSLGFGLAGRDALRGLKLDGACLRGAGIHEDCLNHVDFRRCWDLAEVVVIDKRTRGRKQAYWLSPYLSGLYQSNVKAILRARGIDPDQDPAAAKR